MLTISLSHLLGRGVRLETHEAVALARELLAHPCGIPTLENIQLGSDGSASCISTPGTPSVVTMATLLMTLLPAGTPNVPAPLRYALARGLEAVEAPRFASLEEFSRALERFEKGPSREVLRGLLQRGARPSRPIAAPFVARTPVTQPAAEPSLVAARPAFMPPRPTFVARKPVPSSNEPSQPIAASPISRSVATERAASAPLYALRCRALAASAALVASFAVGFVVGDRITDRHAPPEPSGDARVSSRAPAGAASANGRAARRADVEAMSEIVLVPETPSVARDISSRSRSARADTRTHATGGLVEHVGEQAWAIQAVRATQANAFSPAFAPDGTAIFFHTGRERDARSAIEVATGSSETGGGGITTIVDDGSRNYHAQPSPDGRLVAFDSDRDGERGIYLASRDGSQVRRVSGAGYAAVPTWSRNSEWLAYIRPEADRPSVWNLWVQRSSGGSARRVTNYRHGQTWAASWFPDDRRIAYSHEDTLVVMDLETGGATRYRAPVKGQLIRTPAVSPDGTKIIFQVFRHGAWLVELADGSMQRVLTDPTAEEFAWSPDGRRVAFHSRRGGRWGIFVMSRS